jgi:hypothetical protein
MHNEAVEPRASIHLPPKADYVQIEVDGETAGFLRATAYDQVFKDRAEFDKAMKTPGAEEEAHSTEGRWVVRVRGEAALRALHGHLSKRD